MVWLAVCTAAMASTAQECSREVAAARGDVVSEESSLWQEGQADVSSC